MGFFTGTMHIPAPLAFLEIAAEFFGNLIHEPTKQLIQELLKNLVGWTRRISPAGA
jgi:hypothetical protein